MIHPVYKLIFQLSDWLTLVIMWNIEKLMKIYLFKVKYLTLLTYQKLVGRRLQGHFTTIWWVIWPWEGYEGISNRASRISTFYIPSYPGTCSVWYTFISFLYPLYNMVIWLWEGYEDWRYIKQSKYQDFYVWLLLNT